MKVLIFFILFGAVNIVEAQKTQYPSEPDQAKVDEYYRPPCEIVVDISTHTCKVKLEDKEISFWCETSLKGIGFGLGSNKTPTGRFLFVKNAKHRYGKVLRLTGPAPADLKNPDHQKSGWYQGWMRGILVHKDYGAGSKGCVNLSLSDMNKLFDLVIENYDTLIIQE